MISIFGVGYIVFKIPAEPWCTLKFGGSLQPYWECVPMSLYPRVLATWPNKGGNHHMLAFLITRTTTPEHVLRNPNAISRFCSRKLLHMDMDLWRKDQSGVFSKMSLSLVLLSSQQLQSRLWCFQQNVHCH